ncbi:MAG: UbiD family decarboxylase [Haloferacaceae archaeon]
MSERGYHDMGEHLERLEEIGRLERIDREINKDTELHPLVRWQFRGGIDEEDRKAFLFTNVVDSNGRSYDVPVAVGALSANPEIYATGMGASVEEIPATWESALSDPLDPVEVGSSEAPVHEVVYEGEDLESGHGLDHLPVPISTPGFDNAPYWSFSGGISHDPETGTRNIGIYRGQQKSPTRTGIYSYQGHGIYEHWQKARERGEPLPVAFTVSAPPVIAYTAAQSLSMEVDEFAVAGALAGAPIREVEAKTIPVKVPADADIVIEGQVRTDELEPEGPFGESHGYMALQEYNMIFEVSAITRRRSPIYTSIISQVTPSESSVIKKVALEPLFFNHLTRECNIDSVVDVELHEPLTNLRRLMVVQMADDADDSEVWRALYATVSLRPAHGKIVVAVDEDIDPSNLDALFWAMSYRSNPAEDIEFVEGRNIGHAPKNERGVVNDSAVLWDATLKQDLPPISLPKQEFMEDAREIWEELDLPELDPEPPWYGYSLGEWDEWNEIQAERAVQGRYYETGEDLERFRRPADEVNPNEPANITPEDVEEREAEEE